MTLSNAFTPHLTILCIHALHLNRDIEDSDSNVCAVHDFFLIKLNQVINNVSAPMAASYIILYSGEFPIVAEGKS